jgi:hypothetical protein
MQLPLFPDMRLYSMPAQPGTVEHESQTILRLLQERTEAFEEMERDVIRGKIKPVSATRFDEVSREIERIYAGQRA